MMFAGMMCSAGCFMLLLSAVGGVGGNRPGGTQLAADRPTQPGRRRQPAAGSDRESKSGVAGGEIKHDDLTMITNSLIHVEEARLI